MSAAIIVIIVIAIILLIVQAVLSSLAASEIRKGQNSTGTDATNAFNRAHTYSTAAAVTAALCIVGLIIAMVVVIHQDKVRDGLVNLLQRDNANIRQHVQAQAPHVALPPPIPKPRSVYVDASSD